MKCHHALTESAASRPARRSCELPVEGEAGRVRHDFTSAAAPNRVWLTDITEHWTGEGKLYLCAIKDACSGRIVGYSIDSRMTSHLAVTALNSAVARRAADGVDVAGCIVHSDRGSQGEFNRSSQHLDREVKRWEQPHGRSGSVRIEDRSRHRDGPRSRGGRTESRSGRLSLAA